MKRRDRADREQTDEVLTVKQLRSVLAQNPVMVTIMITGCHSHDIRESEGTYRHGGYTSYNTTRLRDQ